MFPPTIIHKNLMSGTCVILIFPMNMLHSSVEYFLFLLQNIIELHFIILKGCRNWALYLLLESVYTILTWNSKTCVIRKWKKQYSFCKSWVNHSCKSKSRLVQERHPEVSHKVIWLYLSLSLWQIHHGQVILGLHRQLYIAKLKDEYQTTTPQGGWLQYSPSMPHLSC